MVQHSATYNGRPTESRMGTAPFSMTLNDRYPGFKVIPFLMLNVSETVRYTDIVLIEY